VQILIMPLSLRAAVRDPNLWSQGRPHFQCRTVHQSGRHQRPVGVSTAQLGWFEHVSSRAYLLHKVKWVNEARPVSRPTLWHASGMRPAPRLMPYDHVVKRGNLTGHGTGEVRPRTSSMSCFRGFLGVRFHDNVEDTPPLVL
jgi:hypothetical protein